MFNFHPFAIVALITALVCYSLFILLTIYGRKKIHRIWSMMNFCVGGWAFFLLLASMTQDPQQSYLFWRLGHCFGIFIAVFFFHTVVILCNLKFKVLLPLSYLYCVFFDIVQVFGDGQLLYYGVKPLFNSFYYLDAKNLNFFLGMYWWFALVICGHYLLYQSAKKNKDKSGLQAKVFLIFCGFGFFGGSSTFLPMYEVNIYPLTFLGVPIYGVGLTYSIFKHELMDIRVIIEKSIMYSVSITSITVIYLTSIMAFEKLFQNLVGYQTQMASIVITLIIAVCFNPLKNKIENMLNRALFRGTTAEIAQQNQRLRQQVEQSERYKTMADLTGGIVKEIANPLKTLKESDADLDRHMDDPAFMQTYARREQQEIEKINVLLEHLTNYSNPTHAAIQQTNIHKLLNETIGMLKGTLTEKNIKLVKEFKAADIELNVDASQIRQALSNVIANAIEAMPGGGKLYLGTSEGDAGLQILIQDTGEGIKEEDLARIYDPFFTRKSGHTGLGLSVTRGIIENHQGKIRVRSEAGFLTEFMIELPVPAGSAAA